MILTFKSSFVMAIEYRNRNLTIMTTNGNVYQFSKVPSGVAIDFAQAKSRGQYFNQHIRGEYECEKMLPRTRG